jgi:hypothetical protein
VLPQPTLRIAAVAAIIFSRAFALDDIDKKGHTKKAGSFQPILLWLLDAHDLRTTTSIDSIGYAQESPQKPASNEPLQPEKSDVVNKP